MSVPWCWALMTQPYITSVLLNYGLTVLHGSAASMAWFQLHLGLSKGTLLHLRSEKKGNKWKRPHSRFRMDEPLLRTWRWRSRFWRTAHEPRRGFRECVSWCSEVWLTQFSPFLQQSDHYWGVSAADGPVQRSHAAVVHVFDCRSALHKIMHL